MKFSSDFRYSAREALRGKWLIAVLAGLVASLLGGIESGGFQFNVNFGSSDSDVNVDTDASAIRNIFNSEIFAFLLGLIGILIVIALVTSVIFFILGSIVKVGYARFNLELIDMKEPSFNSIFAYFTHWKSAVSTAFIQALIVFALSLLFIIPGIIASYSYAMTGYILAENPELSANEVLSRSKEMMRGNRRRLFCLQFSFIGWSILALLTFGIGGLWLTPYRQAATAAFYRHVSGTELTAEAFVETESEQQHDNNQI